MSYDEKDEEREVEGFESNLKENDWKEIGLRGEGGCSVGNTVRYYVK